MIPNGYQRGKKASMLLAELQMRLSALTSDKHLCPICGIRFDTLGLMRSHEFRVHTDAFKANLRASGDTFAQDPLPRCVECQLSQLFTGTDKYLHNIFKRNDTTCSYKYLHCYNMRRNQMSMNLPIVTKAKLSQAP